MWMAIWNLSEPSFSLNIWARGSTLVIVVALWSTALCRLRLVVETSYFFEVLQRVFTCLEALLPRNKEPWLLEINWSFLSFFFRRGSCGSAYTTRSSDTKSPLLMHYLFLRNNINTNFFPAQPPGHHSLQRKWPPWIVLKQKHKKRKQRRLNVHR